MLSKLKRFFNVRFTSWLQRRIPAERSITLDQRKIFIFPSIAGLYFCVLLLLMLVVAINYQNNMAFALLFLLASVFVVVILHTYLNLSGLKIDLLRCSNAFVGDYIDINLRFSSLPNRDHIGIRCVFESGSELEFSSSEHQEFIDSLFLMAEKRGRFKPPRLLIETFYPLGLLRAWTRLALDAESFIYPMPIMQALRLPFTAEEKAEGDISDKVGSDDFFGFKEYQLGHSLKHVHWPSYAKGQPLLSKEYSELSGQDWVLDWQCFEGDVEQKLSALCYWVLEFGRLGRIFAMKLPGQSYGPDSGERYQDVLLKALAIFNIKEPTEDISYNDLLTKNNGNIEVNENAG